MASLQQFGTTMRSIRWQAPALGLVTVAELVLLMAALVPVIGTTATLDDRTAAPLSFLWWHGGVTKPTVFVIVSLVGGALGGALHSLASLTIHVANDDFDRRWILWYLTNPIAGAALATVFLFVLQAGLGGQAASNANGLYGVAASATLTGLFSRHALRKLKDIFDVAFSTSGGTS